MARGTPNTVNITCSPLGLIKKHPRRQSRTPLEHWTIMIQMDLFASWKSCKAFILPVWMFVCFFNKEATSMHVCVCTPISIFGTHPSTPAVFCKPPGEPVLTLLWTCLRSNRSLNTTCCNQSTSLHSPSQWVTKAATDPYQHLLRQKCTYGILLDTRKVIEAGW